MALPAGALERVGNDAAIWSLITQITYLHGVYAGVSHRCGDILCTYLGGHHPNHRVVNDAADETRSRVYMYYDSLARCSRGRRPVLPLIPVGQSVQCKDLTPWSE